jgi:hypothetical protein
MADPRGQVSRTCFKAQGAHVQFPLQPSIRICGSLENLDWTHGLDSWTHKLDTWTGLVDWTHDIPKQVISGQPTLLTDREIIR